MTTKVHVVLLGFAIAANAIVGCGKPEANKSVSPNKSRAANGHDDDHAHLPGAHGGIIVPIGRDNYHAEAVFEKGGIVRLYTLGKDESKVQEIESQSLAAFVKEENETEATSFTFEPDPQPGDSSGKTSRFVGRLPETPAGKSLEVTIPSVRIGGDRFRVAFKSNQSAHSSGMPAKVDADEENALYLTPGGKYTQADIQANGNVTASQKFNGVKAAHDLRPAPGQKICPITLTKANPKFTWIVDGKGYEFCCPPCVDEFVKTAKENPDQIKKPEEYVKQ